MSQKPLIASYDIENSPSQSKYKPNFNLLGMSPNNRRPLLTRKDSLHLANIKKGSLSTTGAIFAMVNIYVGIGLLSKPYALAAGGWISLVALAFVTMMMSYTAKLLVRVFAKRGRDTSHNINTDHGESSFQDVGYQSFGNIGKYSVVGFVLLEFSGAVMISLIFLWQNAELLLNHFMDSSESSITWIALISTLILMPSVWYLDFSKLTFVSIIGVLSNTAIVLCCIGITMYTVTLGCESGTIGFTPPVCDEAFRTAEFFYPKGGLTSFSIAIGIYILSLAGHAALPSIYHEMEKPEEFEQAVDISFFIMFLIYALIAVTGFLVYGFDVNILVSKDISNYPGNYTSLILTALIVLGVACTVAPVITIIASIPEEMMGWHKELEDENGSKNSVMMSMANQNDTKSVPIDAIAKVELKMIIFRTIMLLALALIAYVYFLNRLDILEAATGAMCTMATSMVFPALFGLVLLEIDVMEKIWCIVFAIVGFLSGIGLTALDVIEMIS